MFLVNIFAIMSTAISPQQTGIQLQPVQDQPISDATLSEYGRRIQFDDKYIKKANEVCKKVCDALKGSDVKPERFSMSESHVCQEGKDETGVDIVAFLNQSQNMDTARAHIQAVVNNLGASNMTTDDKGTMHFDMDQVHVNLGTSLSRGPTVGEHRRAVFQQTSQIDREGKLKKNQIEKVSVDLHDSMSEFMQREGQSDFDLAAQRLARAWRRTALAPLGVTDWFSPLDSMLVMQNALRTQREFGVSLSMRNVMRSFLNDMSRLSDMNVTFPQESLYDWNVVPSWIQQERPLLLDPVNPWRNPLSVESPGMFSQIERTATEAMKVLDNTASSMRDLFNVTPEQVTRGA